MREWNGAPIDEFTRDMWVSRIELEMSTANAGDYHLISSGDSIVFATKGKEGAVTIYDCIIRRCKNM